MHTTLAVVGGRPGRLDVELSRRGAVVLRPDADDAILDNPDGLDGCWLADVTIAPHRLQHLAGACRDQGIPLLATGRTVAPLLERFIDESLVDEFPGDLAAVSTHWLTVDQGAYLRHLGWVALDGHGTSTNPSRHPSTSNHTASATATATATARGIPGLRLTTVPFLVIAPEADPPTGPWLRAAHEHAAGRARGPIAGQSHPLPRNYLAQMRSPSWRWWRPALALWLALVTYLTLTLGPLIALLGIPDGVDVGSPLETALLLVSTAVLSFLGPAALLAQRISYGGGLGRLLSVAGRPRLRLLGVGATLLVALGCALGGVAATTDATPHLLERGWLYVGTTVALTGTLAAGEELVGRGLLGQSIGGWVRRPRTAAVLAALASVIFSLLWRMPSTGSEIALVVGFAGCASYLTWRTGGLESAFLLNLGMTTLGALLRPATASGEAIDGAISLAGAWAPHAFVVAGTVTLLLLAGRLGLLRGTWRTPAVG